MICLREAPLVACRKFLRDAFISGDLRRNRKPATVAAQRSSHQLARSGTEHEDVQLVGAASAGRATSQVPVGRWEQRRQAAQRGGHRMAPDHFVTPPSSSRIVPTSGRSVTWIQGRSRQRSPTSVKLPRRNEACVAARTSGRDLRLDAVSNTMTLCDAVRPHLGRSSGSGLRANVRPRRVSV